jgi:radical SAM superfamily enzyme YgiQ (UPF0313 family)
MKILFLVKDIEVEHLGIMYIASILEPSGHQVRALEAHDFKTICRQMRQEQYPLLASSVTSSLSKYYQDLYSRLKEKFDFKSLWGGSLPTFYPQIIKCPEVDMVCRGEGEYPMLELADCMEKGLPVVHIKNLWIKAQGSITENPLRPPVQDLDSLPFPKRDIFSTRKTRQYKASVIATRGCAYSCPYCCASEENNQQVHGDKFFRKRSVDNLIAELRQIKALGYKFVLFEDSSLVFSEKWLEYFAAEYSKNIRLPFYCNVRAEQINEKTAGLLARANCHSVSLGVETASDFLRKKVLGRQTSKKQIFKAVEIIKNNKMKVKLTNMLGLPYGDILDDLKTLVFNRQLNPDYSKSGALSLFEGTNMIEHLQKNSNSKTLIDDWQQYRKKNKSRITAFRYLFGIFTEVPLPIWVFKVLICLPCNTIYKVLYYAWDGYCSHFRIFTTGWMDLKRGLRRYCKLLLTE